MLICSSRAFEIRRLPREFGSQHSGQDLCFHLYKELSGLEREKHMDGAVIAWSLDLLVCLRQRRACHYLFLCVSDRQLEYIQKSAGRYICRDRAVLFSPG